MLDHLEVHRDRLTGDPYLGDIVRPEAVAELRMGRHPPEVVLRDGRIGFVPEARRRDLGLFGRLHAVPFDAREDVWDLLTEPFLDTTFDAEHQEATVSRLEALGFARDEVEAIRRFVGPSMLLLTSMTWEWVSHGLYDVLLARPIPLLPAAWIDGKDLRPPSARFADLRHWAEAIANRAPPKPVVPAEPDDAEVLERLRWRFLQPPLRATGERWREDQAWVDGLRTELLSAWSSPGRRYHTPRHLLAVLDGVVGAAPQRAFLLAGWFHDAIYDPTRAGNEEDSARWLERVAPDLVARTSATQDEIDLAATLIRATGHPLEPLPGGARGQAIARFLDADFGVFASLPHDHDHYVAGVREEFAFAPDAAFRIGRRAFLDSLRSAVQARGRFFHDASPLAEHLARENLARELAALG